MFPAAVTLAVLLKYYTHLALYDVCFYIVYQQYIFILVY